MKIIDCFPLQIFMNSYFKKDKSLMSLQFINSYLKNFQAYTPISGKYLFYCACLGTVFLTSSKSHK